MEIKIADKINITNPEKVAKILQKILKAEGRIDQDKEHFWVVGLNPRNVIKYLELVSLGTLDTNLVHPREVFRLAIVKAVAQIIIAHNHPSGNSQPSPEDVAITKQLVKAGKILGIEVIDHIIIAGKEFASFKDKRLM